MEYRRLGQSEFDVSVLCLGTATFGVAPLASAADALVGRAIDAGINWFDTANSYGNQARFDRSGAPRWDMRQSAETILGRALRSRRDEVLISSKVCEPVGPTLSERGLSQQHITAQLEASLRRLGTDHIDVYHAHRPDPTVAIDETLAAFDAAIWSGKVRAVGISNYSAWETVEALWAAERGKFAAPVCNQVMYNLANRRIEADLIPAAERFDFSITVYSPLYGGLLAGPAARAQSVWGYERFGMKNPAKPQQLAIADKLDKIAADVGIESATLALQWVLAQPTIASVVIGAETIHDLESAIGAVEWPVNTEVLAALVAD